MLKSKNKAKPTKAKGKRKYTKLEKIQLHINASLGRPGPKVLPRLTDEEYLILQSKLLLLKNEQIGLSNSFQPQSGLFSTPQLLSETQLPQLPPDLPIGMNPAITSGYELIQGNIIPAPIPDTLDRIGAQPHGIGRLGQQRVIENPTSEQRTPNSVQPTFGMDLMGGSQPRFEHSATPYKATQILKPPEYIGPQIAITHEEAKRRDRAQRAQAARDAYGKQESPKKKTGKSTGRGYEGDISNRDLAAKRRYDKAKSKVEDAIGEIEKLNEKGIRGKFDGERFDEKMKQLDDAVEVATRNLQQAEEELDRRATAKGLDAGRFKTPNIDVEGEEIATDAGAMTAGRFDSTTDGSGPNITFDNDGSTSVFSMDDEEFGRVMEHVGEPVFSSSASDQEAALDRYTARLGGIIPPGLGGEPSEFEEIDTGYYEDSLPPRAGPDLTNVAKETNPMVDEPLPPPPATDMAGEPVDVPEEEPEKKKEGRGGARKNAGRKKGGKNKPKP